DLMDFVSRARTGCPLRTSFCAYGRLPVKKYTLHVTTRHALSHARRAYHAPSWRCTDCILAAIFLTYRPRGCSLAHLSRVAGPQGVTYVMPPLFSNRCGRVDCICR